MARPKADLPSAEALLALADDQRRLAVRVTPGARSEGVFVENNRVTVKVRAKPQDGAANAAVVSLLAKALNCPASSLTMLRGATSREKLFQLSG